jgi:dienelactone hydrolase
MRKILALLAAWELVAISAMAQSPQTETRPQPVQSPVTPDFRVPTRLRNWEKQRREVRHELWRLLGKLPPRPSMPQVKVRSREDRGDFRLEQFEFDNGAGSVVPGLLLLPQGVRGRAPAILYCHWHGGEYEKGKVELFRHEHTPFEPGPTLARRGYVVLAIDAYGFGERRGLGPGGPQETGGAEELSASKYNLWVGRTLWGMMLRDDLMALDYLASRAEVDPARIGVTGMSMGATRSWWLMALDERVRAGVAVACLTRYQDLIARRALAAHGIYYYVPGVLNHFDTEAIVSLIAPRPALFLNGDRDAGSPAEGIHKIEAAARRAYALYDQPRAFASIVYEGVGHDYTPDMWERMLRWMEEHLQAR